MPHSAGKKYPSVNRFFRMNIIGLMRNAFHFRVVHLEYYILEMLQNWTIKICGSNVILVPYTENHVDKYHEWMKDKELQRLTGSEPLNLEEEYEMQKTWRDSTDKVISNVTNIF